MGKGGRCTGLLKVTPGQKWIAPEGFPQMSGMVDSLGKGKSCHANTLLLRLDTPAPGSAWIGALSCSGMVVLFMSVYFYGDKAKAALDRDEPTWQNWMAEQLPMPSEPAKSE